MMMSVRAWLFQARCVLHLDERAGTQAGSPSGGGLGLLRFLRCACARTRA